MFFYASDTISKTKVHTFHGHFISWSLASTKQLKNNWLIIGRIKNQNYQNNPMKALTFIQTKLKS